MADKKIFILAGVLLLLVGVYAFYAQKISQESKPTGKAVDISQVDPDFELKVNVSKAIRAYMRDNGKAPSSLNDLKGKYLNEKIHKIALAKNMEYKRTGEKSYRISLPSSAAPAKLAAKKGRGNKQAKGTTASSGPATTPGSKIPTTTETGWKYDPVGKPDPFKPFILAKVQEEVMPKVVRRQQTPLQKMPLSEIQAGLKAIVWGQLGNKALVEDATGKGYVVQVGTYVGQNDGIVKKIFEDRIIVEEYRRDPARGRLEPNEVVLKLKKVEAEE